MILLVTARTKETYFSKTSSYLDFEEYNTAGAVTGRHCQVASDMVVLRA